VDVAAGGDVHFSCSLRWGFIIFYLLDWFIQFIIAYTLAPPNCEWKYQKFTELSEIEGPLHSTLHQMEEIWWMRMYPLTHGIVIISSHEKYKQINLLYMLLYILRIFIHYLPTKPKCNHNCNHSNSRKDQHDMGKHFAHHWSNSVHRIVEVMCTFHQTMHYHQV